MCPQRRNGLRGRRPIYRAMLIEDRIHHPCQDLSASRFAK
jgi:hypothetical protein